MSFWQRFALFRGAQRPAPLLGGDITDPEQIHTLLETARDHDEPVTIRIFGYRGSHATAILDVNREKGYLIFDGLADRKAHDAFLRRKRFLAGIEVDGIPLKFESNLAAVGVEDGIPFYRINLPPKVRYLQRRAWLRVDLLDAETRFTGRYSNDDMPLSGFLRDISEQGVTLILDQPVNLLRRETLSDCLIEIPGIRAIRSRLRVCHAEIDHEHGTTLVGANFHKPSRKAMRRVRKAVARFYAAQQAALGKAADAAASETQGTTTPADETAPMPDNTQAPPVAHTGEQISQTQQTHPEGTIAAAMEKNAASSQPSTQAESDEHELGWHIKTVVATARQESISPPEEDLTATETLHVKAR